MKKNNLKKKIDNKGFSVGLGLLDYINPIFYSITVITIISNLKTTMSTSLFVMFIIGATLSIIFGLTIPTVKLIVGLGLMEFKMPVNLVAFVNTGIFISGISLLTHVLTINPVLIVLIILIVVILLFYIYKKTKKINTIAVLIGAVGYVLMYVSLITIASKAGYSASIVMYAIAIMLFVMLCGIGIKANLMNPKIHWVIEISNVICQFLVALSTALLFTFI